LLVKVILSTQLRQFTPLNLPASASIGDFVAIKDYAGTFATYNLTIGRNGHNIQGVANNSLITTNRASLVLVYVDATKGWLYWEEHNVGRFTTKLYMYKCNRWNNQQLQEILKYTVLLAMVVLLLV
jgi:hypothetical protein